MIGSRLPRPYTPDELRALDKALSSRPVLKAACTFLGATGLRVGEFASITREAGCLWPRTRFWCHGRLCRHHAALRIVGKGAGGMATEGGGKERMVVLTPRALKAARILLAHPSRNGRGDYLLPWSIRGFHDAISRAGQSVGVHAHPHRWRHTFATRLAESGAEPYVIMAVMGHTSLETSMAYIGLSVNAQRKALRRAARF